MSFRASLKVIDDVMSRHFRAPRVSLSRFLAPDFIAGRHTCHMSAAAIRLPVRDRDRDRDSSSCSSFSVITTLRTEPSGTAIRFPTGEKRAERLWGPAGLLSSECWGLFPLKYSGLDVKLTAHLHLVPRSRMVDLHLHSPIRLLCLA
jgi:hypothetical protein